MTVVLWWNNEPQSSTSLAAFYGKLKSLGPWLRAFAIRSKLFAYICCCAAATQYYFSVRGPDVKESDDAPMYAIPLARPPPRLLSTHDSLLLLLTTHYPLPTLPTTQYLLLTTTGTRCSRSARTSATYYLLLTTHYLLLTTTGTRCSRSARTSAARRSSPPSASRRGCPRWACRRSSSTRCSRTTSRSTSCSTLRSSPTSSSPCTSRCPSPPRARRSEGRSCRARSPTSTR
eukprot:5969654-Prymnesium_polylepis.2